MNKYICSIVSLLYTVYIKYIFLNTTVWKYWSSIPNSYGTVYYKYCIDNIVSMLKSRYQVHNVFTTSILWRQIQNLMLTLPQHWIVNSPHIISWILWWQCWYNFVIATSNRMSFWRRYYDVAQTLRQLCEE